MSLSTDILVIGTGIAGLIYSLKAAEFGRVTVLTKKVRSESNTNYAQGGIASVTLPEDSFDSHIQDTLEAGAGLCHEDIVKRVITQGPQVIEELSQWGVEFSHDTSGAISLGKEGGHSYRRVLHAGDFTGQKIESALLQALAQHPNVEVLEHHFAVDLITTRKLNIRENQANQCLGAYVLDKSNGLVKTLSAQLTVLCTGGSGKVYLYTSNPDIATGDGLAMAWRAGAKVANLEFVQFHPTCLYHPKAKNFLLSEALRGESGALRLINGETFMEKYHRHKELAPRDVVARAIDFELKKRGEDYVLLDMTHIPADYLLERFPNLCAKVKEFGYDMTTQPIPVVPAAHYQCGGVMVDQKARTSLKNLLACGEVSFTGLHGANRLASNSLLEAVVYAQSAAQVTQEILSEKPIEATTPPPWDVGEAIKSDQAVVVKQNWDEIRELMWNYAGIVRRKKTLSRAKKRLDLLQEEIREYYFDFIVTDELLELRNIATVAELIVKSALWRKESRGLHYNLDYPAPSEMYRRDTIVEP